ncbi:MAG: serine hydrolase, partial [Flavisolibacter sp.]
IGSCTKAFTTSIIGLLQKQGKLDIDKPAKNYLNDLNFYSADLTNQVTLRDMMSHRTGLPRHDISWYLFNTANRDSLMRRIQYQEPTFPLRRQWQYNNFMFVAQGAIAEKISGKSWEDLTRELILEPLGMSRSNFSVHQLAKEKDVALGYGLKKDSFIFKRDYYDINAAGPAGSINSSVMEMSNWVMAWINDGKFNGKEILPSVFVKEAISSQSVVGSGFPSKEKPGLHFANYGLGWFLSSYKEHYRVEHGGNIDGFSASTSFYPTDSIGIIVLVNQDGSSVPAIVRNLISDRLLKMPYFDWNGDLRRAYEKNVQTAREAEKTKTSAQVRGTKPAHALKDYEGIYSHPGYGSFEVFVENDSLFSFTPNKKIWLKHYHYEVFNPHILEDNKYDTSETGEIRMKFNTGINGEVESMDAVGFESAAIKLEFKKTPRVKAVSASSLEEYVGSYEIAGTEIKYYMKGSTLYMFVEGQPEYELLPVEKDKFSLKILSGYAVQFLRNDKNVLEAVNLIQPNGTFKANRKK